MTIAREYFRIITVLGQTRAVNEQVKGKRTKPNDNLWEVIEPQDLVFQVTGEKLDPDTNDDAMALIDAYETAYYDQYDDADTGEDSYEELEAA